MSKPLSRPADGPDGLTAGVRSPLPAQGAAYSAYVQAFSLADPRDIANARAYAYRLLKTVEVKQLIRDSTAAVRKRLRVEADTLIHEAAIVARSSVGDYFDFDTEGEPRMKPAREIDATAQRAIRSIERTERKLVHRHPDGTLTEETRVTTKFTLLDKLRSLQLLYRHFGLDKAVNPLEALLNLLPLELQHRVAEVLRATFNIRANEGHSPPVPSLATAHPPTNGEASKV